MDVKATMMNSVEVAHADRAESMVSRASQERDIGKIKQLSKDFEAIFLEQMLRTMRSSVQKSGLIDGGNAEEIYRSMLDSEYAKLMAGQSSSGLAQMIERQLLQTMGVKSEVSQISNRQQGLGAYERSGVATLRPAQKEVKIKSEDAQILGKK